MGRRADIKQSHRQERGGGGRKGGARDQAWLLCSQGETDFVHHRWLLVSVFGGESKSSRCEWISDVEQD